MPAVYDKMGIRFLYPDNWTLEEEEALRGERSVTVYSPEGAFWSIVLHPPSVDPDVLTIAAMQTMKQEYPQTEAEPARETVRGQEITGYDLSFYYLDLTSTALIRGFRNATATGVILCQAEDRDFRRVEAVFQAITASLLDNDRARPDH